MKTVKLKSIFKKVAKDNDTSMSPHFCDTDDGHYVVKFLENIEGPRGLINEYVCYELAELLEIPIPNAIFVDIDNEVDFSIVLRDKEEVSINSKTAFGSKYLENAQAVISEKMIVDCVNKQDFLKIILFDHVVENVDRDLNYGNLLMDIDNSIVVIIDNERVFGLGNIWDVHSCHQRINDESKRLNFNEGSIYNWMKTNCNLVDYEKTTKKLFSSITSDQIKMIVDGIPDEWQCTVEEKEALSRYLINRFDRIDELLDLILK